MNMLTEWDKAVADLSKNDNIIARIIADYPKERMEISLSIYKVIESSFHDCWSFRHFLEEATTGWLLRPQVVSVFFSADPSLTERPESISTTTFRCQPNRFPASFVLIIN